MEKTNKQAKGKKRVGGEKRLADKGFTMPHSTTKNRALLEQVARITRQLSSSDSLTAQSDAVDLRRSMMRSILNGRGERMSVWLPNGLINVASSAGGIIGSVYTAVLSNCPGYTDWLTVFSTYRIRKARFDYVPYFKGTGTNTGQIAGGVRYGSSLTAPASFAECQQADDSKVVALCDRETWTADFDSGYSDFIAAAFPSTAFGSLIIYSASTSGVGVSTNYGSLTGKILVEFEGLV